MMKSMLFLFLSLTPLSCATVELNSITTKQNLVNADGVMTQVTLHPDMRQRLLYSANYQREGLISVCTPVKIVSMSKSEAVFINQSTGESFRYVYHKAAGETLEHHLQRVFDTRCPRDEISKLGPVDQDGIRTGKISKGMSKKVVILAAGYPPAGSTPDLSSPQWRYWQSKFDTFVVIFKGEIVEEIRD